MTVHTRELRLRNVTIGGGAPITLQSMCNTSTADATATLHQINTLADEGCEIIRLAVPDVAAVRALPEIVEGSPIPVIADIHFDYKLALGAIAAGVDGLRINPGNIGDAEGVRKVAEAAAQAQCVIRVGSNSGSVKKAHLERHLNAGLSPRDAMVETLIESVIEQCKLLETYGFHAIKVSLKSSDVTTTVCACQKFFERYDYPQHIGITEAGTLRRGLIKSALGIGALLLRGVGDTLRVSLTADPIEEVRAGKMILESAGIREAFPEIVSCPTCGRTQVELQMLAEKVELLVEGLKQKYKTLPYRKIAVMGCAVNGPGEARDAEWALCGAKEGHVMICRLGKPLGVWPQAEAFEHFETWLKGGLSK